MEDFFIKIYREQILDQILSAETSYLGLNGNNTDLDLLFQTIHHYIIHASNVVKLVQPKISGDSDFKNYRLRCLRTKYPTLPHIDPTLVHIRNDFEHFDERID